MMRSWCLFGWVHLSVVTGLPTTAPSPAPSIAISTYTAAVAPGATATVELTYTFDETSAITCKLVDASSALASSYGQTASLALTDSGTATVEVTVSATLPSGLGCDYKFTCWGYPGDTASTWASQTALVSTDNDVCAATPAPTAAPTTTVTTSLAFSAYPTAVTPGATATVELAYTFNEEASGISCKLVDANSALASDYGQAASLALTGRGTATVEVSVSATPPSGLGCDYKFSCWSYPGDAVRTWVARTALVSADDVCCGVTTIQSTPAPLPRNYLFVDAAAGSDASDGRSHTTALASITAAVTLSGENTTIYVANGTYSNNNYGSGGINSAAAVSISNAFDLRLLALPGHAPVIAFDGSAGVSMSGHYLEVAGFEIAGPNADITYDEAMANRLIQSNKYSGRGICVWGGSHIHIHDNIVHDTPNSGIRVNYGDWVTIENNHVYDCTFWGSNAESAVVFADSQTIDALDIVKMVIRRNIVYDNVNKIPYYNANYDDPEYLEANQMSVAREWYGTKNQTFIIDGSGVYITRNQGNYAFGRFELSENVCYRNGINGLVVHKTSRAHVFNNVIEDNGQVSKDAPSERQGYAGLTLNHAYNVTIYNNTVSTQTRYAHADYAFAVSESSFDMSQRGANEMNYICNGKIAADFADRVVTLAGCPETLAPAPLGTVAPTPFTCFTIVDGESSTVQWGKLGTNGVTAELDVPAGKYTLEGIAAALSSLSPIVDSTGTEHTLDVVYDADENTLTFAVGDASGGWYITNYRSSGFLAAVGFDWSTGAKYAKDTPSGNGDALAVTCIRPSQAPITGPSQAPTTGPSQAPPAGPPPPTSSPTPSHSYSYTYSRNDLADDTPATPAAASGESTTLVYVALGVALMCCVVACCSGVAMYRAHTAKEANARKSARVSFADRAFSNAASPAFMMAQTGPPRAIV